MTNSGVFKQKSKLRTITYNPTALLVGVILQQFKKVLK
jgi:hypothetical protein